MMQAFGYCLKSKITIPTAQILDMAHVRRGADMTHVRHSYAQRYLCYFSLKKSIELNNWFYIMR